MSKSDIIYVTAGIIQEGDRILIARRSPQKHLGGFWELPGGKLEVGETEQECLQRELQEELGIRVKVGEFFMQNQHQYGEKTILLKAYYCELVAGEISLHDHDKYEWVLKEELSNYDFAPADVPFLVKLLNG